MVSTAELAAFTTDVDHDRLPEVVRTALKKRVLDAVGIAVDASDRPPVDTVRRSIAAQNVAGRSRLWATELSASPPDAALYNATLLGAGNGAVFLSPTLGTPSDSIAAVFAAGEAYNANGEDILAGLAAAFEIHGELSWTAPLDGVDPSTHSALAATAGVGRTLGFESDRLETALDIVAFRPARPISRDDGFEAVAGGVAAREAIYACVLADNGLSAPEVTDDHPLDRGDLDLDPGCERVLDAAVLPYDTHPYAQSAIEAAIDLAEGATLDPADVESVRIVTAREATEHVDEIAVAAALVDRELSRLPSGRVDLEPIAESVSVEVDDDARVGRGETPTKLSVDCRGGAGYEREKRWFTGHPASPVSWGVVEDKFTALASDRYDGERRREILDTVEGLEAETAVELCRLLD